MILATDMVLGVDGGGTNTTAWLALQRDASSITGQGTSGPCNLRLSDPIESLANLQESIQKAFDDAGLNPATVGSACLSLAGCDREEERAVAEHWAASRQIADRVLVTHDALAALYAATSDGVGIALVCGTGSIAFGRNPGGNEFRCGGWGHLLGDEGSGYAIALAGFRAAARAEDGRGTKTELTRVFADRFGVNRLSEVVSQIYSDQMGRPQIAQYARMVFQAKDAGDAMATQIVERAASELAELVMGVARALRLQDYKNCPLALTGGVLLHRKDVLESITQQLQQMDLNFNPIVVEHPVAGAVSLARQAASKT